MINYLQIRLPVYLVCDPKRILMVRAASSGQWQGCASPVSVWAFQVSFRYKYDREVENIAFNQINNYSLLQLITYH